MGEGIYSRMWLVTRGKEFFHSRITQCAVEMSRSSWDTSDMVELRRRSACHSPTGAERFPDVHLGAYRMSKLLVESKDELHQR